MDYGGFDAKMWLMGLIDRGDEVLHYSDGQHRWIAPADADQTMWEDGMRAHLAKHRAGAPEMPRRSSRDAVRPPTTGTVPPPTT